MDIQTYIQSKLMAKTKNILDKKNVENVKRLPYMYKIQHFLNIHQSSIY